MNQGKIDLNRRQQGTGGPSPPDCIPPSSPEARQPVPAGRPRPSRRRVDGGGRCLHTAFCSRRSARASRLLCYPARRTRPSRSSSFVSSTRRSKTGSIWHCRIPAGELRGATLYAYRVEGPHDPEHGQRFDPREDPARSLRAVGVLPAELQPRSLREARPTDGRAPLGRLPKKEAAPAPLRQRSALHLPRTRSFMNCTSKASPRARTPE